MHVINNYGLYLIIIELQVFYIVWVWVLSDSCKSLCVLSFLSPIWAGSVRIDCIYRMCEKWSAEYLVYLQTLI